MDAIDILLVEDNPGDVRLTREAFKASKLLNRLHVVGDGEQAMAFLRREGVHADAPRPGLVLLDLNMPRMGGREALAAVKADEDLRRIPIVILTSSEADEDVVGAYDLHANAYIRKPVDLDQFVEGMRKLGGFWLEIVRLPG